MSKKAKANAPCDIGGQAVMEGVMMKAPDAIAITVRRPDGAMVVKRQKYVAPSEKHPWMGWPLIRGVVNMASMLYMGMTILQQSTEMLGVLEEEPSQFERWRPRYPDRRPGQNPDSCRLHDLLRPCP